jgi:hypothetical protein
MDTNVYANQISIMEETVVEFEKYSKDMYRVALSLKNKMAKYIDERILIDTYEQYEKAFNNFDKTNNQK